MQYNLYIMSENATSDTTKQLPVSLRLPENILKKIDEVAEDTGSSRSAVLVKAINNYITSPRCIRCGAINPSGGINCAVCGTPLYSEDELIYALKSLGMVGKIIGDDSKVILPLNSLLEVAKGYYQKYKPIGMIITSTFSIDKSKNPIEYRIKLNAKFEHGSFHVPNDEELAHMFLNDGVIVPQKVLIERLEFNRANMFKVEYESVLDYIKRQMQNK